MISKRILQGVSAAARGTGLTIDEAHAGTQISFITPEWLAAHSRDSCVRVLDVRQNIHDYFEAHVPGAVHLAESSLRAPRHGIPVQYLPPRRLADLLARAGVTRSTAVVVYSEGENVLGASMVAYALERIAHPRVMILDGGWTAYVASHPTTQAYPSYRSSTLFAQALALGAGRNARSMRVDLSEVRRLIGSERVTFVDARPEPVYLGQTRTWIRNGHIPGARSLDWHLLVHPDNPHKIKPREELMRLFASRGLDEHSDIILYCGTSREASLNYVIAKHILGFPRVRLYEGSWTEYAAYPDLPVATGPEPAPARSAAPKAG